MTNKTQKVIAYITYGKQLLVFCQPDHPDAGIQVPAGTVEIGEDTQDAVLREAFEETGLRNLVLHRFLGCSEFDMAPYGRNEIQKRSYFHLLCTTKPPLKWQHEEHFRLDGNKEPVLFKFFWVDLPDKVPELAGGQGALLEQLKSIR